MLQVGADTVLLILFLASERAKKKTPSHLMIILVHKRGLLLQVCGGHNHVYKAIVPFWRASVASERQKTVLCWSEWALFCFQAMSFLACDYSSFNIIWYINLCQCCVSGRAVA